MCNICKKTFEAPFKIWEHLREKHNTSHPLICQICNYYTNGNSTNLRKHMLESHKFPEMPYSCKLCGFRSSFFNDVLEHFETRHAESSYLLCKICLKTIDTSNDYTSRFLNMDKFLRHLLNHHSRTDFKCHLCRLSFYREDDRKKHVEEDHRKFINFLQKTINFSHKVDLYVRKSGLIKKIWNLQKIKLNGDFETIRCIECNSEMEVENFIKHLL